MMAHRKGAGYSLYPPDSAADGDGTYARLTGWEEEGNTLRVKRIELIHRRLHGAGGGDPAGGGAHRHRGAAPPGAAQRSNALLVLE